MRDRSNTDISTVLTYLGALFTHALYPHNLDSDSFRTFLCSIFHQYDDSKQQDTYKNDSHHIVQPYQNTKMDPRNYCNVESTLSVWNKLRPKMTPNSPDILTYTYGLVSILPHTN